MFSCFVYSRISLPLVEVDGALSGLSLEVGNDLSEPHGDMELVVGRVAVRAGVCRIAVRTTVLIPDLGPPLYAWLGIAVG